MLNRLFSLCLLLLLTLSTELSAQIISRTIFHSGGNRIYDLHLPSGWQSGDQLPLVLDLHYLGGDARDEDTLTNMNGIADTANFILCHPWGQGTNWNVGFATPYTAGARDVDFIRTVIDTIANEFGVDRARIYATGMGQGGFMVHRLACELSDEIAAVAAVGASITDSAAFYCQPSRPVPVMMIHGTADSVVPYPGNPGFWPGVDDLVDFWLDKNGCPGATPTTTALPDPVNEGSTINSHRYACNQDSEVLLYEVVNGGFSWPGATVNLPNGGIINQDINAGANIWEFFRQWELPGTVMAEPEASEADLALHFGPNPVADELQLSFRATRKPIQVRLLNLQGQSMLTRTLPAGTGSCTLNCQNLPAGMYLLQFESAAGRHSERLLKL